MRAKKLKENNIMVLFMDTVQLPHQSNHLAIKYSWHDTLN